MASRTSDLSEIRGIAEAARDAASSHEAKCDERWEQNRSTLSEMRGDIKSLIDVQPRINDPWRDYWRLATFGLISVTLAVLGAMSWRVFDKQGEISRIVTEISVRGQQNREDIVEIKADLKDVKSDQKDTNAKVQSAHEAITRLEAKTP